MVHACLKEIRWVGSLSAKESEYNVVVYGTTSTQLQGANWTSEDYAFMPTPRQSTTIQRGTFVNHPYKVPVSLVLLCNLAFVTKHRYLAIITERLVSVW